MTVLQQAEAFKLGEAVQGAMWFTGEETPERKRELVEQIKTEISTTVEGAGFAHGEFRGTIMMPGEADCPEVPDHIQGVEVVLMILEVDIVCRLPNLTKRSFVGDLDRKDLMRIRAITRGAHLSANPGSVPLTDAECDDIIERIGPESAMADVRNSVDSGTIH